MARKLARRTIPEPEPEPEKVEELRPEPLLYNVADACYLLGNISKQMLYRLIHLKRIHPVKIGTRSLFTIEELQRFVGEQQNEDEPTG
jgi:excisionase family DNA binding protein